jgi:hypothetical protein
MTAAIPSENVMDIHRRRVLTTVAVLPALALPGAGYAYTKTISADHADVLRTHNVAFDPASTWSILERVTDGTNPSTSVAAPPKFTPEIRKLTGTEVTLTGYLHPATNGFGRKNGYLLTRDTFHCLDCYPFGRGSLAMAMIAGHAPMGQKVAVRGTLRLQESDAADFYFRLLDGKII